MKVLTRFAVVCVVACTAACTSTQPNLALAPIGPRRLPVEAERQLTGSLVVYSAFEAVNTPSDSDQRRHSDYELRSADGAVIKRVSNQEQTFSEDPATVKLAPGRYSITARANASRRVDVPIVIEADKTTCVRLDGSEPIGSRRVAASEMVRLPDGTPVGWRVRSTD
jgi:hypothetical protein